MLQTTSYCRENLNTSVTPDLKSKRGFPMNAIARVKKVKVKLSVFIHVKTS